MSDLLSAAGLLLAIVTMLYSLWYREMEDAAATPVPWHEEDRRGPYKQVWDTWRNKALPLLVATSALTIVLVPDAVKVLLGAARRLWQDGLTSVAGYDAVKTAYVLVTVGSGFMAVRAFAIMRKVRRKLRELKAPREAGQ